MKMLLSGLMLVSELSFAVSSAGAATYYVSSTADDATADGSLEHPYTMTNALAHAKSGSNWETGDHILVLPGTYDCSAMAETKLMPQWNHSIFCADKAYLTIAGSGSARDAATFVGGGTEQNLRAFRLTAKTSFSNLTFRAFGLKTSVEKGSSKTSNLWIGGGLNTGEGTGDTGVAGLTSGGAALCADIEWAKACAGSRAFACDFIDCEAGCGAGAYLMTVTDCRFTNCRFSTHVRNCGCGAVYGSTCTDCTFSGCYGTEPQSGANDGRGGAGVGGVYSNCLFTACSARNGAALACSSEWGPGGFSCYRCAFSNLTGNASSGNGLNIGGFFTECLFISNRMDGAYGVGRSTTCTRCLVTGNTGNTLLGGTSYNCLVFSNAINAANTSQGGLLAGGTHVNTTLVSNQTTSHALHNGSVCYNTFCADTTGFWSLSYGSQTTLYSCLADRAWNDNTVQTTAYVNANAAKWVIWGPDPIWGIWAPISLRRAAYPDAINHGTNLMASAATIWTAEDVDYAGKGRLNGPVDIGCYERWPKIGLQILVR